MLSDDMEIHGHIGFPRCDYNFVCRGVFEHALSAAEGTARTACRVVSPPQRLRFCGGLPFAAKFTFLDRMQKDGSTPMKAATPTHSSKPLPGGDLRVADVPDKLPTGGSNPDREAGVLAKAGNSVSGEDSCAFSGKIRDTLRCHADGAHTLEWTGSGRGQKTDLSASESCNSYTLEGVVDSTIEVFGSSIRTPSILGPENNRSMRGWNIIEPITEVDSEGSASLALRVEGTNEPPVPLVRRSTWNLEEFSSGLLQPDIKSAALMTANYIGRANEPCADVRFPAMPCFTFKLLILEMFPCVILFPFFFHQDKVASATGMSDPGIGRSENQDAFTAYAFRDNNGIETSLLGVFDGHGPEGMCQPVFACLSIALPRRVYVQAPHRSVFYWCLHRFGCPTRNEVLYRVLQAIEASLRRTKVFAATGEVTNCLLRLLTLRTEDGAFDSRGSAMNIANAIYPPAAPKTGIPVGQRESNDAIL